MTLKPPNVSFDDRVAEAFANPERLEAIRRAGQRFTDGRERGLASLPDANATRDYGRAIRAHTISRLDEYLIQFEESVIAAGGQVHWAGDAEEARAIVIDIARKADAKQIAKSKSMVTEEIGLNAALEDAGMEVVETDLGEFIAQKGNDHPSHIIAPILHLTRQEVGHIFEETLDVPYTDDPIELNTIARGKLRDVYLTADVGITGCNFGVAETGTVSLVTNEGNARMVTALPRIHIALMGMERLVPTMEDLSVMLQILARSATGQKLSVYSTLITGPKRPDEAHGPEEVHIIILDNGRSKALGTDLAEILYCIRCGACLNICPVYRAIGGHAYGSVYPGPVGSVVSPVLGGVVGFGDLPQASTLCGACKDVCPVRIDLPTLLLRLRRDAVEQGQSPGYLNIGMKGYAATASKPGRFRIAARFAGFMSALVPGEWFRGQLPGPLRAWTRIREFPLFARQSFQQRWKNQQR